VLDVKLRCETLAVEKPTEETRRRAILTVTALATRAAYRESPATTNPGAAIRRLTADTLAMLGLVAPPTGSTAAHGTVARAGAGCECRRCDVHARNGVAPGGTL